MLKLKTNPPLILASSSPWRAKLLAEACLDFTIIPSQFDEETEKQNLTHLSLPDQALILAKGKAYEVSQRYPECLVLGADQMGELAGEALFKPGSKEKNIEMLTRMGGCVHFQHTAASLFYQGNEVTHFSESVKLIMRKLSHQEIQFYVEQDEPWECAGGYRFEGLGKHLFVSIEGSRDSVLGLPMLLILNYLHDKKYL